MVHSESCFEDFILSLLKTPVNVLSFLKYGMEGRGVMQVSIKFDQHSE